MKMKILSSIFVVFCSISSSVVLDKSPFQFSADGRLLQLEYASKASQGGPLLTLGLDKECSVLICSPHSVKDRLLDRRSIDKVQPVGSTLFSAFTGYAGDGRYLIRKCREYSASFRDTYGCEATLEAVANFVANEQYKSSLSASRRPLAVQFVLFGRNENAKDNRILLVTPTGEVTSWECLAVGKGYECAMDFLESNACVKLPMENLLHKLAEATQRSCGSSTEFLTDQEAVESTPTLLDFYFYQCGSNSRLAVGTGLRHPDESMTWLQQTRLS